MDKDFEKWWKLHSVMINTMIPDAYKSSLQPHLSFCIKRFVKKAWTDRGLLAQKI